jgi:DsbC/DsbD-like thiol-disulfide interchange protein
MKYVTIPLLLAMMAPPALAEAPLAGDLVKATILPGWRTADGRHMAALRLELAPGWKTYWRAPGEAGIPPEFDWTGSQNVAGVRLHWPRPVVFDTNGMQTIGYHDVLVLPVEIDLKDQAKPLQLSVNADLGVCRDICVPAQVHVTADIGPDGKGDAAIRAALADQPLPARKVGLSKTTCAVEPIADGLRVTASMTMPELGPGETVVLESAAPGVWVSEAMALRDGNTLRATADMVGPQGQPFALNREDLRITVLAAGRAVETRGCTGG